MENLFLEISVNGYIIWIKKQTVNLPCEEIGCADNVKPCAGVIEYGDRTQMRKKAQGAEMLCCVLRCRAYQKSRKPGGAVFYDTGDC